MNREAQPPGTLKVSPGQNRDCIAWVPANMNLKEKVELK